jgi:deoxyribonuclease IV
MKHTLLLGAHTSIGGGLHNALLEGKAIGATTVQIFTANQRQWVTKSLSQEDIDLFQKTLEETGLQKITSHDSYLINLGSPKDIVRKNSIRAFREEIIRCQALNLSYLNFHPGSALDESRESCLKKISAALLEMRDLFEKGEDLVLLLETTAGQGSTVGSSFEEITCILDEVKVKIPVGVCIDTCHIFAAGYDIRTEDALNTTLDQFDKVIGLQYLKAMHLNDSVKGLGSHVDRHSPLGEGMIGKDAFMAIMQSPRLAHLPKYLETPGGPEVWVHEIAWLKKQVK